MIYLGWLVLTADPETQVDALNRLPGLLCEAFQLCTSVGCACVTGVGEQVCNEQRGGWRFPRHHSEGPTWAATFHCLEKAIQIDLYYNGPILGNEYAQFRQALTSLNAPVFGVQGSGSTMT